MNWRIIVGLLLIYGSGSEALHIYRDHHAGKFTFYPGGILLGVVFVCFGLYLIYKGFTNRK